MELQGFDTCHPVYFDHFKLLKNCDALCTVCNTAEKSDELWHRYQLSCGCISHTRCLRKFLKDKNSLYCKKCDKDLQMSDETRCCGNCSNFGHSMWKCTVKENPFLKLN